MACVRPLREEAHWGLIRTPPLWIDRLTTNGRKPFALSLSKGGRKTKPIPRWDVHFGGLEDDLKDSTALHLTFTSQLGATDSAV